MLIRVQWNFMILIYVFVYVYYIIYQTPSPHIPNSWNESTVENIKSFKYVSASDQRIFLIVFVGLSSKFVDL
jgi:hypothetical protein